MLNPTSTATFFNIDILTTFEDAVIVKTKQDLEDEEGDKGVNGDTQELKDVGTNANGGEPRVEEGDEHYRNVEV